MQCRNIQSKRRELFALNSHNDSYRRKMHALEHTNTIIQAEKNTHTHTQERANDYYYVGEK